MTRDKILARLVERICGRRTMENAARGFFVEELVALALEPEWRLCSGDYAGWDFIGPGELRIQVKQSAARQSWKQKKPFGGAFRIAATQGYWVDGSTYVPSPGRHADIYIFAWHPVADDTADHRDPGQWVFFVIPTNQLPPNQKSISRTAVEKLGSPVRWQELSQKVRDVSGTITKPAASLPIVG